MAECPGAVVEGALRGGRALHVGLARSELLCVDQVVGHQDLRVEFVLEILWRRAGENVERILGVGELSTPPLAFGTFGLIGAVADEFGQFVEQRNVGGGELVALAALFRFADWPAACPVERCAILVGPARRGLADGGGVVVEVTEDVRRSERRPEREHRLADIRIATHVVANVLQVGGREELRSVEQTGADRRRVPGGECVECRAQEHRLGLVVRPARPSGRRTRCLDERTVDFDPVTVEVHGYRLGRQRLVCPNRALEHVEHL